jgi:hypothetical protein
MEILPTTNCKSTGTAPAVIGGAEIIPPGECSLREIFDRIDEEHQKVEVAFHVMLEPATEAGRLLHKAKKVVGRGTGGCG